MCVLFAGRITSPLTANLYRHSHLTPGRPFQLTAILQQRNDLTGSASHRVEE
jgi:hypothetical protein